MPDITTNLRINRIYLVANSINPEIRCYIDRITPAFDSRQEHLFLYFVYAKIWVDSLPLAIGKRVKLYGSIKD